MSGLLPPVPLFDEARDIPAVIHQTARSRDLPKDIAANVAALRHANPGWTHRLYTDADVEAFILERYGADIAGIYARINPVYGAARADFFRYLLMYSEGGVYLDLKSTVSRPLAQVIRPDDRYILAHWRNDPGSPYEQYGWWEELSHMPHGEYQQWHIVAAPGHPYLRAVIERVIANIDGYDPGRDGVGREGVIRTTGPVAYTLAIAPIRDAHPHRLVRYSDEIGLEYTIFPEREGHITLDAGHYTMRTDPVVL